jgi:hypothetical protein
MTKDMGMEYIWKELRKTETIERAFEHWKLYRTHLTNCILENVEHFDTIAIFGAGASNDIDLNVLENRFDKLIVLDRDIGAMKEGLKQYHLEHSKKVEIVECDFLGITDDDYCRYEQVIRNAFIHDKDINVIEKEVLEVLNIIIHKINTHMLDFGNRTYSNVVAIGVHSQLNALLERIWSIYAQAFKQNSNRIYDFIKQMNYVVANKLNSAVLKSVSSKLIIGYELTVAGMTSRVEGAFQAEYDLMQREKNDEIIITASRNLKWNFYQETIYDMNILTIEKNNSKH